MEILILVGGRVGGNTERLCSELVGMFPDGVVSNLLNISKMDISHCIGCERCKGGDGCIHDDDMSVVFEAFDRADVVLFATPVRFNGPSSIIKTMMDRFQELWNDAGVVEHRRRYMGLLMTSGSDNPNTDPCLRIFRSFCLSFGGEWIGYVLAPGTDSGRTDFGKYAESFYDTMVNSVIGPQ